MILPENFHTPVLLPQVIEALRVERGKKYIDATVGGGGYTDKVLKLGGIVLGIDRDQDAIDFVRKKFEIRNSKFEINEDIFLEHGNFKDLKEIAHSNGFDKVAGIIFDLGMSSFQLKGSGRGFSYQNDEMLDMRMDLNNAFTAVDLINSYSREKLYEIFTKFAEELHSGAIADAIVFARSLKKVEKTGELVRIIDQAVNQADRSTKARIFQAIRIEVNGELDNLGKGLAGGIDLLATGGRIAVLSYHSLEDRLVKLKFREAKLKRKLKLINTSPIGADISEILKNPKSKSVKLRIAEKICLT